MKSIKNTHIYKRGEGFVLELDVYLPDDDVRGLPVVVYLHGGALIWGSRERINEAEIAAFASEGFAYISIDYRLAPETKLMDIQTDIEDALQWVRTEGANIYGLDASRIVVLGKSAGGYLALLSGTLPVRPKAIVSFYGYGDILGEWYAAPSPHYLKSPLVSQDEAARCVTSGLPTQAPHEGRWNFYLRARQTGTWASLVSGYDPSEASTALTSYCPIRKVDDQYPPTFLLHGSVDTDVPVEQSVAMHAALIRAGVYARLHVEPNAGHGFDAAWKDAPNELGLVFQFLRQVL